MMPSTNLFSSKKRDLTETAATNAIGSNSSSNRNTMDKATINTIAKESGSMGSDNMLTSTKKWSSRSLRRPDPPLPTSSSELEQWKRDLLIDNYIGIAAMKELSAGSDSGTASGQQGDNHSALQTIDDILMGALSSLHTSVGELSKAFNESLKRNDQDSSSFKVDDESASSNPSEYEAGMKFWS